MYVVCMWYMYIYNICGHIYIYAYIHTTCVHILYDDHTCVCNTYMTYDSYIYYVYYVYVGTCMPNGGYIWDEGSVESTVAMLHAVVCILILYFMCIEYQKNTHSMCGWYMYLHGKKH